MAKQYLMVENTGQLPKACILYAGSSTKRNDSSSIGQFGTGFKFAAVLALKLGLDFLIQTEDWQARPIVKPEQFTKNGEDYTLNAVAYEFKYPDSRRKEVVQTSFTTEMGLNWTEEYQLVREIICNGVDEQNFRYEIVNKPEMPEAGSGLVRVYVQVNDEIQRIINNFDYYFVFNAIQLFTSDSYGQILPGNTFTVYTKRVMIEQIDKPSLFRYNLPLALTEERRVQDSWDKSRCLGKLWAQIDSLELIKRILLSGSKGSDYPQDFDQINWSYFNPEYYHPDLWIEGFHAAFGKKAVLYTKPKAGLLAANLGYNVVDLYENLGSKLVEIPNFPTDMTVLGNISLDYDYDYKPNANEKKVLDQAVRIVKLFYPNLPLVKVFKPLTDAANKICGMVTDNQEIALNHLQLKSVLNAVATINHERRHIDTGAGDGDRVFVDATDDEIANLMIESAKTMVGKVVLTVTDRGFKLPGDVRIALDSTAHIAVLDHVITILVDNYRLEANLEHGVGRSWATSRAVTIYKKGYYVNCPKEIRDKLPGEVIFSIR